VKKNNENTQFQQSHSVHLKIEKTFFFFTNCIKFNIDIDLNIY